MAEKLNDLTPNQRRALSKALTALETMAAIWGAEIRINEVAQKLASKPESERAKAIAAFIEQAFIEGAYRHYLDRDPAANPQLTSQPSSGDAEDIMERCKNPMTPYGMLVRALRIVAGTTLMDMANHLGTSPARLSGMEHARRPITHLDVVAASGYFHGLGIPTTLTVLERAFSVSSNATIAAPSAAKGGSDPAQLYCRLCGANK